MVNKRVILVIKKPISSLFCASNPSIFHGNVSPLVSRALPERKREHFPPPFAVVRSKIRSPSLIGAFGEYPIQISSVLLLILLTFCCFLSDLSSGLYFSFSSFH